MLFYDRSSGIRAATPETQKDFTRALAALRHALRHRVRQGDCPRDPGRALQILENYLRMRLVRRASRWR